MAKLTGPLLSMAATQSIGKTITFFPWKGLNVARQYVVPANPKTALQTTQRGYLTSALSQIHAAMGWASHYITEVDKTAWQAKANLEASVRTWFNQLVKQCVDQRVAGLGNDFPTNGVMTAGAAQISASIWDLFGAMTAGRFYYGVTPGALVNYEAATLAAGNFTATISSLTAGTKYYVQFRPTAPASVVGCNSGIYHATPT